MNKEVSATLVEAIFPEQFDNHICTLDNAGTVRFWNISGGIVTTIVTNIHDVRAFCFGAAQSLIAECCGHRGQFRQLFLIGGDVLACFLLLRISS